MPECKKRTDRPCAISAEADDKEAAAALGWRGERRHGDTSRRRVDW